MGSLSILMSKSSTWAKMILKMGKMTPFARARKIPATKNGTLVLEYLNTLLKIVSLYFSTKFFYLYFYNYS